MDLLDYSDIHFGQESHNKNELRLSHIDKQSPDKI